MPKLLLLAATAAALTFVASAHAAVVGWGDNQHGELCAGYKSAGQNPVASLPAGEVAEVVSTYFTTYARLANGTVEACGGGTYGQLGNGTHTGSTSWVGVNGLGAVKQVAAGGANAMALLANGTVMVWGSGSFGQLGNGFTCHGLDRPLTCTVAVPQLVPHLEHVAEIATGGATDLARLENGVVRGWGENKQGQIADGTNVEKTFPATAHVTGVRTLAIGGLASHGGHALYLLNDGTVRAAGGGSNGQLGNGSEAKYSATPVPVTGLTSVTAVSASASHNLALTGDGRLMAWGANSYGELGVPTEVCVSSGQPCAKHPVGVPLQGCTHVSAGMWWSEAVCAGNAFGAGLNDLRQLGDGTAVNRASFVHAALSGVVSQVSAGEEHTSVLAAAGPPPQIEAVAGVGSITVTWSSPPESHPWTIEVRPVAKPVAKWGPLIKLPGTARSYTAVGLIAGQPYEIRVGNVGFGSRIVVATPLAATGASAPPASRDRIRILALPPSIASGELPGGSGAGGGPRSRDTMIAGGSTPASVRAAAPRTVDGSDLPEPSW